MTVVMPINMLITIIEMYAVDGSSKKNVVGYIRGVIDNPYMTNSAMIAYRLLSFT